MRRYGPDGCSLKFHFKGDEDDGYHRIAVCLPFSWWRTRDAETQMTLIKPEKNGVPAYAAALCREIESLGRDMQEYRVDTLWFDGGYMGLFMPEQLEAILAARIARSI